MAPKHATTAPADPSTVINPTEKRTLARKQAPTNSLSSSFPGQHNTLPNTTPTHITTQTIQKTKPHQKRSEPPDEHAQVATTERNHKEQEADASKQTWEQETHRQTPQKTSTIPANINTNHTPLTNWYTNSVVYTAPNSKP